MYSGILHVGVHRLGAGVPSMLWQKQGLTHEKDSEKRAMEDVSSFGREMIFHHRTGPFRRSAEGRLHEVTLRADENGYVLFRRFKGDIKTKQPAPVDGLHSPLRMIKFADCK